MKPRSSKRFSTCSVGVRAAVRAFLRTSKPPKRADAAAAEEATIVDVKAAAAGEPKGLEGDYGAIALLLLLYTLQGVPMGLAGSVPLSEFIGSDEWFGAWDLNLGLTLLILNDSAIGLTDNGDDFQVIGSVGISRAW